MRITGPPSLAVTLSSERSRLDGGVGIYWCKGDPGLDMSGFVLFGAISVDSARGRCPGALRSLISLSSEPETELDDKRFTTGASVIGGVAGYWAFPLPTGLRNASILVLSACVASRASYSSAMAFPSAFTR
jgi:hypothetical protein